MAEKLRKIQADALNFLLSREQPASVKVIQRHISDAARTSGRFKFMSIAATRNGLIEMEAAGLAERTNNGPGERHHWKATDAAPAALGDHSNG